MEESQELEKLPRVITGVLKVVLSYTSVLLALSCNILKVAITFLCAILFTRGLRPCCA